MSPINDQSERKTALSYDESEMCGGKERTEKNEEQTGVKPRRKVNDISTRTQSHGE